MCPLQHVIVEKAIHEVGGPGLISESEQFGLFCAKYVISEAIGCFISVCDHRNPGKYPVRLPRAAGFLQSRAAPVIPPQRAPGTCTLLTGLL
jgi:hypothetical protein